MKSKMDVIAMMSCYKLRRHTGSYTFGFIEGKYRFSYHSHSTGRDLTISIISLDGDQMQVYERTEWYSSSYYFNGFGNGFVDGPWVKEIKELFVKFKNELVKKLCEQREMIRKAKKKKEIESKNRFNKFASLCD